MPSSNQKFPGGEHLIPIAEAAALTARFRAGSPKAIRGYLFDRKALDAILGQPGCAGLRIYRAAKPGGEDTLVLVGTDTSGSDLLTTAAGATGLVAEEGLPCPPACSAASPLEREDA